MRSADRRLPAADIARASRSRREERAQWGWDTKERQGMTRRSARLAHRLCDNRRSRVARLSPPEPCTAAGSRAEGAYAGPYTALDPLVGDTYTARLRSVATRPPGPCW